MQESSLAAAPAAATAARAPAAIHTPAPAAAILTLALTPAFLGAQQMVQLPAEDRPLDAGFEEVYRVGSVDGGDWDTFGRIGGVAFDAAGNLYILDTGAVRISVVDPRGELVRQFIGEGEGPGEFGSNTSSALEFTVTRDGRALVYDPGRVGFAVFAADGVFERTVRLGGSPTHFPLIGGLQAFPEPESARVLTTTQVNYLAMSRDAGDEPGQPGRRNILILDLNADEARVDSVAAWEASGSPGNSDGFWPRLRSAALPGGWVAYTDSSAYAIKLARPGADATRVLTRPFRPRPVTDRVREAEIERRLEDLDREAEVVSDDMERAMIQFRRGQIESMEFYHEVPVLLNLRSSWEGTIWVLRRGDEGAQGNPIDLITPDGSYLGTFAPGTVALPRAFGPDGLAAWVETDELDVPTVVVRRLPPDLR